MLSKPSSAGVLAVASSIGALAAWSANNCGHLYLAIAEAFAGGILLSAGLLHLLPDSAEDWKEQMKDDYPWPFLLCIIGCVGTPTHVLESLASMLWETSEHISANSQGGPAESNGVLSIVMGSSDNSVIDLQGDDCNLHEDQEDAHDGCQRARHAKVIEKYYDMVPSNSIVSKDIKVGHSLVVDTRQSVLVGPLLMVALSVHSMLEGLSLGASDQSRAMHVFLAILAHKGVSAFALGTAWLSSGRRRKQSYMIAMTWFTCMTPVGIILGRSAEGNPIAVTATGLSAGTFLYIGLVEGCPGVRSAWLSGMSAVAQLLAFILGSAAMALLAYWT